MKKQLWFIGFVFISLAFSENSQTKSLDFMVRSSDYVPAKSVELLLSKYKTLGDRELSSLNANEIKVRILKDSVHEQNDHSYGETVSYKDKTGKMITAILINTKSGLKLFGKIQNSDQMDPDAYPLVVHLQIPSNVDPKLKTNDFFPLPDSVGIATAVTYKHEWDYSPGTGFGNREALRGTVGSPEFHQKP
jgi:hypothetical protein